MNVEEFMTDGIQLLEPAVEARFGRLEFFTVRRSRRDCSDGSGNMSYEADLRRRRYQLSYYPKSVENDLQSCRHGLLVFGLVHELLHFYGLEHMRENVYLPWCKNVGRRLTDERRAKAFAQQVVKNYRYAREGVADLAAFDLCIDLVASGRSRNLLSELFGEAADPDALADYLAYRLAQVVALLVQTGRLDSPEVEALSLPFALPDSVVQMAESYARCIVNQPRRNDYRRILPYYVGLHRCARIVASEQRTLSDLLAAAVTNRQLKHMSDRADTLLE